MLCLTLFVENICNLLWKLATHRFDLAPAMLPALLTSEKASLNIRAMNRRIFVALLLLHAGLFAVAPSPCGGFCALVTWFVLYYGIFAWLWNLIATPAARISTYRFMPRLLMLLTNAVLLLTILVCVLGKEKSSTLRVWTYALGISSPAIAFPLILAVRLISDRRRLKS